MSFRSLVIVGFASISWLVGCATSSRAAETMDFSPPSLPTKVKVGVFLIDLISIDGASQTFTADTLVTMSWSDPRLAKPGAGERRMARDEIWSPKALVTNLRATDPRWADEVTIDEEGGVVFIQRSISTFACPLDLRRFPHDKQDLHVHVLGVGVTPKELVFEVDEATSGRAQSFSITDWTVGEFSLTAGTHFVQGLGVEAPSLRLDFPVERLTSYYFGTIFATVAIIASMAWLVYWLPVDAVNPRISVSVTSMLSLIAYRFVASQDLPKLPYLTSMDHFLLGAALLILIGLVTVVVVAHQQGQGRLVLAKRLNLLFRWLYPAVLVGLLISLAGG